jgi:hypothetical protein
MYIIRIKKLHPRTARSLSVLGEASARSLTLRRLALGPGPGRAGCTPCTVYGYAVLRAARSAFFIAYRISLIGAVGCRLGRRGSAPSAGARWMDFLVSV